MDLGLLPGEALLFVWCVSVNLNSCVRRFYMFVYRKERYRTLNAYHRKPNYIDLCVTTICGQKFTDVQRRFIRFSLHDFLLLLLLHINTWSCLEIPSQKTALF